jgi:hypothetical protein
MLDKLFWLGVITCVTVLLVAVLGVVVVTPQGRPGPEAPAQGHAATSVMSLDGPRWLPTAPMSV